VIVCLRFRPEVEEFAREAEAVLAALAERPGFVRGGLGRAVDDPALWLISSEWESVGSYRRALGAFDVRMTLMPLSRWLIDEPTAFETFVAADSTGVHPLRDSDRATEDKM
jgi:heme oxygenase (mycobilin-producing)